MKKILPGKKKTHAQVLALGLVCSILAFGSSCHSAPVKAVSPAESPQPNLDAVKASPDKFKVLLENDKVRVVEYTLKPGEKDNWHTHPPKSSYVVSGGKLKIVRDGGETLEVEEKTGSAGWAGYLGKHYAENIGTTPVTIVLTEIK